MNGRPTTTSFRIIIDISNLKHILNNLLLSLLSNNVQVMEIDHDKIIKSVIDSILMPLIENSSELQSRMLQASVDKLVYEMHPPNSNYDNLYSDYSYTIVAAMESLIINNILSCLPCMDTDVLYPVGYAYLNKDTLILDMRFNDDYHN